jgi:hypothetical protein
MKRPWSVDVENGLSWTIWTYVAQVMGKRKVGSQTGTKSRESTWSRCAQVECDTSLERSGGELQLWFRSHSNQRLESSDMSSQSLKSPNQDSFGTPSWESREKVPFGCSLDGELQRILYGGRWWLPPSLSRGESSSPSCPWLVPTPKVFPNVN